MTFRVTVRDNRLNGGGSNYGSMTVTSVATAGPFAITGTLNAAGTIAGGSTQTVTWNVASSDLAPINCANVKISLSTDGGNTFPIVLAASAPNNGSALVTIPNTANVATTQGRIKVEAVGNIFFDISDANLVITSTNTAPTLNITGGVTVARGTPTPTVAVVGNASDAEGNPISVSVSNLPGDVSVTPSIAGGSVSLSVHGELHHRDDQHEPHLSDHADRHRQQRLHHREIGRPDHYAESVAHHWHVRQSQHRRTRA